MNKFSNEYIENELKKIDIGLLSKYENAVGKLKLKCKCGEIYYKSWHKIKTGFPYCKKCGRKNTTKARRVDFYFIKSLIEKLNCSLLSNEYKNNTQSLKIKCKCGNIFYRKWNNIRNNTILCCDGCNLEIKSKMYSKTTSDFKNTVKEICDDFEVIGDYKNNRTKIKMLYKPRNIVFETTPANFISKKRNSYFSSKGEMRIKKYLIENNINFKEQFTFEDLKNEKKLRFDFAIFDENSKLKFLLEYDGQAHFKSCRFANISLEKAKQNLIKQKYNDGLKTNYCKLKNLNLKRISYLEFNQIEKIMEDIVWS